MSDIATYHLGNNGFNGCPNNQLYDIAAQALEYHEGTDRLTALKSFRSEEAEITEINDDSIRFEYDGVEYFLMNESLYETLREQALEDMCDMMQDEVEHSLNGLGTLDMYVTFDRESFVRDLEYGGDVEGYLSPYDGVVSEMYVLGCDRIGSKKYYRQGTWYMWRTD